MVFGPATDALQQESKRIRRSSSRKALAPSHPEPDSLMGKLGATASMNMNSLFQAAVEAQQQQDMLTFPSIGWSTDDEDNNSETDLMYLDNSDDSSICSSSSSEEDHLPSTVHSSRKRKNDCRSSSSFFDKNDSHPLRRMVRSREIHTHLWMLAKPSTSSNHNQVAAQLA